MADLSEAAKAQIANIQIADAEIVRLQQQLALAQTNKRTPTLFNIKSVMR